MRPRSLWLLPALAALAGCETTSSLTEPSGNLDFPVAFSTETDPQRIDLLAGQSIDVGDVLVWNTSTHLYVKFDIDPGWCLTETHLAVGASLADLPTNKSGNPVPGQFPYSHTPACAADNDDLYELPLPAEDDLVIAAHAQVWDMTVTRDDYYSGTTDLVAGPLAAYAGIGSADWGTFNQAVAAWVHQSWPSLTDAMWISSAYYVEDAVNDSWRRFSRTITVPGYPVTGAVEQATSDNAEEAYLNGTLIGSDGEVQGPFTDDHEWSTFKTYAFTPVAGENVLEFIVRNYALAGGTTTSNPTGLIYHAWVEYYAHSETAWGKGTRFTEKSWGMYFEYTVMREAVYGTSSFTNYPTLSVSVDAVAGVPLAGTGILEYRYFVSPYNRLWNGTVTCLNVFDDGTYRYAVIGGTLEGLSGSDPAPDYFHLQIRELLSDGSGDQVRFLAPDTAPDCSGLIGATTFPAIATGSGGFTMLQLD